MEVTRNWIAKLELKKKGLLQIWYQSIVNQWINELFLSTWEPFSYCKEKFSDISEGNCRFSCIFFKILYIVLGSIQDFVQINIKLMLINNFVCSNHCWLFNLWFIFLHVLNTLFAHLEHPFFSAWEECTKIKQIYGPRVIMYKQFFFISVLVAYEICMRHKICICRCTHIADLASVG